MTDKNSRYDIVFAANEKFAGIMAVALTSVLEENRTLGGLHIHILDDGISENTRTDILRLRYQYNADIRFINVKTHTDTLRERGVEGYHGNYTVYARLLIPELLDGDVKKVLYLDSDVLVIKPLLELFQKDMHNKTIAGVLDPSQCDCIERLPQLSCDDVYINTGVLLIDCERWRKYKYTDKIKQLLFSDRCIFLLPDQDIVNIVFQNDIHVIDLKYNLFYWIKGISSPKILYSQRLKLINGDKWYSRKEYISACRNTAIIHFVRINLCKPWQEGNYGHELWANYASKTSFGCIPRQKKYIWLHRKLLILIEKTILSRLYLVIRKYKGII